MVHLKFFFNSGGSEPGTPPLNMRLLVEFHSKINTSETFREGIQIEPQNY